MCSECEPVEAVEGEVPAKEVCSACIAGYELGTDGEHDSYHVLFCLMAA
jgi:hypothetical protein